MMGLRELLAKGVVIGDGAFGSMLYENGVFINACFEELNISNQDLIKSVHNAYVASGCDFIETNTYGANRTKLASFGIAEKLEEINRNGVALARDCAGGKLLVAGSVGPISSTFKGAENQDIKLVEDIYEEQLSILDNAGVDFFIFETFSETESLLAAIRAASNITSKEIIATIRPAPNWRERGGHYIKEALLRVAEMENVTAVGFNCGLGPSDMLELLSETRNLTAKPFCVQPNAGLPQTVDGRTLYMCTPEYMAEYSKRFYEKGADIIGGCCGTGPNHIRQIARAVRGIARAQRNADAISIEITATSQKNKPSMPLTQRSNLGRKIANGEFIKAVEITPPRSISLDKVVEKAIICKNAWVDAVNIPDGPRASFRQSALATAVKIAQAGIEPILHVCARDRNIIALQSDMLAAASLGVNNMLFITGDPPKLGDYPDATGVFDLDAIGLARMASMLNCSMDIAGSEVPEATAITIGVGVNPGANDYDRELERFRMKVRAGAEYCITQPVFDKEMFCRFADDIADLNIPILAGIWPFTSSKNSEFMANEVPGITVPQIILDRMAKTKTREEGIEMGVQIAAEAISAIRHRIAGLVVSAPFGNVQIAISVLDGL